MKNFFNDSKVAMCRIAAPLAIFCAGLSGCALTVDQVQLHHNVSTRTAAIDSASTVSVHVDVQDVRPDKTKVSTKKNRYGMEMASVVTAEDVSVTIKQAIEGELKIRGFMLSDALPVTTISVDLFRFYSDYKVGFFGGEAIADLNMNVLVRTKTGEIIYSKHISAQGADPESSGASVSDVSVGQVAQKLGSSVDNLLLTSSDSARISLNRAIEKGMKSLMDDKLFMDVLLAQSVKITPQ